MPSQTPLLREVLDLAADLERTRPGGDLSPLSIVAFGTVVRSRRLAEAVGVLGAEYAYEARLQVRTLLKLYFNYAWIRLERPRSRAIRFLRFPIIENLRLAEELSRSSDDNRRAFAPEIARLRRKRSQFRHLFRVRNREGKLRWAKTWASTSSFEGRVVEVITSNPKAGGEVDRFLYSLYRWLSGAVHGTAQSIDDVLSRDSAGQKARSADSLSSDREMNAAATILLAVWNQAAVDLRFPKPVRQGIRRRLRTIPNELDTTDRSPA